MKLSMPPRPNGLALCMLSIKLKQTALNDIQNDNSQEATKKELNNNTFTECEKINNYGRFIVLLYKVGIALEYN